EHGNIVHLHERDCSVQRRHQKVVKIAPSVSLTEEQRHQISRAAVDLMKNVNYINAGTVEFLVTDDHFYFIEVSTRTKVEPTITKMINVIELVKRQIKIADAQNMHDVNVSIPKQ